MPNKKISSVLLKRAKKIKLLAMDVDGVLTGGEIIILDSGEELKIWSVKDRMGFAILKELQYPVKLAWITARKSTQVENRAKDIGVHFCVQKSRDKWNSLQEIAKSLNIKSGEIAYIGDDLVDLKPLKNVGLSICPPESPEELKKICHYQTQVPAGQGVVREVIEILVKAKGLWEKAMVQYAVFLFFFFSVLTGCSSQVPSKNFSEQPDQWIENFTITETLGGLPVWILDSKIAQIFNKQKKITLDDIHIQFMNPSRIKKKQTQSSLLLAKKNQTQAARLVAPKGEVQMENRDLKAWGGVEVQSEDGTKLYAEELLYSTAREKITTDSPIKIVRNDSILMGEGLEASPDLSTVKILRHQASIYPKKMKLR